MMDGWRDEEDDGRKDGGMKRIMDGWMEGWRE